MKLRNIFKALACVALLGGAASCDGEKDLIIIEGNLPIKTSTLYLVGDATPNGWSIDNPTPMIQDADDALIFTWEGSLNVGEMKLCLATGSWDNPFIRPIAGGTIIGRTALTDEPFKMHAGDPDDKWSVNVAGVYTLRFDLRNWTMSSTFVREADAPVIEPIATDVLYIVGDATPGGWNIAAPTQYVKESDFLFSYEGALTPGEMKACLATSSWDQSFVRPATDGVAISKDGVAEDAFVFTAGPDNKWKITDGGMYRIEFDLSAWTISATYLGELTHDKTPIETPTLYMIGDATPGGWSMDDLSECKPDATNKYIFTWEGTLIEGNMKACLQPDGSYSCPFIRPLEAGVEINANGVAAPDFIYTTGPDDQWRITEAGTYRITFDLEHYTINAVRTGDIGGGGGDEPGDKKPLESGTLYMIGDATSGGWSMDNATALTQNADNKYLFSWEGTLKKGSMKACLQPDGTFSCPFLRPEHAGCIIGRDGAEHSGFVYTTDPDDQWQIAEEGRYRITFDLRNYTIEASYLGTSDGDAIESNTLYMIGDATPGGWSMDNATALTQSADDKYLFSWEGTLNTGAMKACLQPDGTFSCPFLRPAHADCVIDANGAEHPDFVYTTDPDDKWLVKKAGRYRITFDLRKRTISATYLD